MIVADNPCRSRKMGGSRSLHPENSQRPVCLTVVDNRKGVDMTLGRTRVKAPSKSYNPSVFC